MQNHTQNPHTYSVSDYEAKLIQQHNQKIPLSAQFFIDKPTSQNLYKLKVDLLAFMQTIQQIQTDQAIHEPVKRSVFNVLNLYGDAIGKALSFSEALSLRRDLKGNCLIKYAGMEVVK